MDHEETFFSPTYRTGRSLMVTGYTREAETVTFPRA
jgi:hypothetical protein